MNWQSEVGFGGCILQVPVFVEPPPLQAKAWGYPQR